MFKKTCVALAMAATFITTPVIAEPVFKTESVGLVANAVESAKGFFQSAGQFILDKAQVALDAIIPAAHAAIDLEAVETGLTAAQTSGESVGTLVIGVVAGLAVVGVIIAMVRKL
jgi:hypothetical protein